MTVEEKKNLKDTIISRIENVYKQILDLKELTKPISPDSAIGRISRMDAINNKSVNDAALAKAIVKLSKLENALIKIDSPDFGLCVSCGQVIPAGWISLMPESVWCVRCASLH